MRFVMKWVVVLAAWGGADVGCENNVDIDNDLDSIVNIVYNPSAGPFQDTSEVFYGPSLLGKNFPNIGEKSRASTNNFIFPERLEIRKKPSTYSERQPKSLFTPLMNGKNMPKYL